MNAAVGIKAYSTVSIESSLNSADPHKLIAMLYQGALLAIANAKNGILRKDIPAKGKAISHALRIIDEGLKASLDKNVGGPLAQDLDALYDYMCFRLVDANVKNNVEALDEVTRLLSEIQGAWESIRPSNNMQTPAVQQPPVAVNKQAALVYGRG
jgi:flagellar protein FliS